VSEETEHSIIATQVEIEAMQTSASVSLAGSFTGETTTDTSEGTSQTSDALTSATKSRKIISGDLRRCPLGMICRHIAQNRLTAKLGIQIRQSKYIMYFMEGRLASLESTQLKQDLVFYALSRRAIRPTDASDYQERAREKNVFASRLFFEDLHKQENSYEPLVFAFVSHVLRVPILSNVGQFWLKITDDFRERIPNYNLEVFGVLFSTMATSIDPSRCRTELARWGEYEFAGHPAAGPWWA
jgi:hypothetical protein